MSQPRAIQPYLVRQPLSKWTRKSTHFLQAYSNCCTAGGKERNTSGLGTARDRQKEELETEMEFREESHRNRKVGLVGYRAISNERAEMDYHAGMEGKQEMRYEEYNEKLFICFTSG
jgi:hypothetical protein